eukprot:1158168-Pelagomonas_calceolata.AAC.9
MDVHASNSVLRRAKDPVISQMPSTDKKARDLFPRSLTTNYHQTSIRQRLWARPECIMLALGLTDPSCPLRVDAIFSGLLSATNMMLLAHNAKGA